MDMGMEVLVKIHNTPGEVLGMIFKVFIECIYISYSIPYLSLFMRVYSTCSVYDIRSKQGAGILFPLNVTQTHSLSNLFL